MPEFKATPETTESAKSPDAAEMPTARQSVASILRSLYPKQKTGQPDLVTDAWGRDADSFLSALAEAGLCVVDESAVEEARAVLVAEFADAPASPGLKRRVLNKLNAALAARQPEGERR